MKCHVSFRFVASLVRRPRCTIRIMGGGSRPVRSDGTAHSCIYLILYHYGNSIIETVSHDSVSFFEKQQKA